MHLCDLCEIEHFPTNGRVDVVWTVLHGMGLQLARRKDMFRGTDEVARDSDSKDAQAQKSQMIIFSASFSCYARRTSIRFMRPNNRRNGVGTHQVSSQHNATHRRCADVSEEAKEGGTGTTVLLRRGLC